MTLHQYSITYTVNGQEKTLQVQGENKHDARAQAQQYFALVHEGQPVKIKRCDHCGNRSTGKR